MQAHRLLLLFNFPKWELLKKKLMKFLKSSKIERLAFLLVTVLLRLLLIQLGYSLEKLYRTRNLLFKLMFFNQIFDTCFGLNKTNRSNNNISCSTDIFNTFSGFLHLRYVKLIRSLHGTEQLSFA